MEFNKLIGTGYSGEESDFIWLQENVVNIWRGVPIGAFTYFVKGHSYYINVCIRTSKNTLQNVLVTQESISENIKRLIEQKHNIKL